MAFLHCFIASRMQHCVCIEHYCILVPAGFTWGSAIYTCNKDKLFPSP